MKEWLKKLKREMTVKKAATALAMLLLLVLHVVVISVFQDSTSYVPCPVQRGDVKRTLTFDGIAKVKNQKLVYARYSSKVRNIFVREGEKIEMGSRLVLLENGKLITSEMNGYVGKINIREQEYVTENTNILELYDLNRMTGEFDVNEYDIARIYIGQKCQVAIPSGSEKIQTKITAIDMNARQEGGLAIFKVSADLDSIGNLNLLPGMQLYLSVDTEVIEDCAYIPVQAIYFDEENNPYIVVKKGNRYEHLVISIDLYNGEYAAIREGLDDQNYVYVLESDQDRGEFLDDL